MKAIDKMCLEWLLERPQYYLPHCGYGYYYGLLEPFKTKKDAIVAAIKESAKRKK